MARIFFSVNIVNVFPYVSESSLKENEYRYAYSVIGVTLFGIIIMRMKLIFN